MSYRYNTDFLEHLQFLLVPHLKDPTQEAIFPSIKLYTIDT